jgi:hypothetical protein
MATINEYEAQQVEKANSRSSSASPERDQYISRRLTTSGAFTTLLTSARQCSQISAPCAIGAPQFGHTAFATTKTTEGGRFELPRRGLPACRFSRPVHSTALPPFHGQDRLSICSALNGLDAPPQQRSQGLDLPT